MDRLLKRLRFHRLKHPDVGVYLYFAPVIDLKFVWKKVNAMFSNIGNKFFVSLDRLTINIEFYIPSPPSTFYTKLYMEHFCIISCSIYSAGLHALR